MASKATPKEGTVTVHKKVTAPSPEPKAKDAKNDSSKDTKKDDKSNGRSGSKNTAKDTSRRSARDDRKDSGGSRGGSGRQDNRSRGRDRERRSSRDRHSSRDGRETCRKFLNNRCDKGSQCRYYHPRASSRSRQMDRGRSSPSDGHSVCRDFLRGQCKRGGDCRYYHPPSDDTAGNNNNRQQDNWLTICYDFRMGHCMRPDCRFFHVTRDDEESYRATGEIPLHIVDEAVRKAMVLDTTISGTRPTCKEFLNGICNMQNCRFRHLSQREYEDEIFHALGDEFERILGPPDCRPSSPLGVALFPSIPNFGTPQPEFRDDLMPQMENVMLPIETMRRPMANMQDFEPEPKRPRYFSGDGLLGEPPFPVDDFRDVPLDFDRMDRPDLNPQDAFNKQQIEELFTLRNEHKQQAEEIFALKNENKQQAEEIFALRNENKQQSEEIFALRNEITETRMNAEREINDRKEEARRVLEDNTNLHHEVAKIRAGATEESLLQKAALDNLSHANNQLMDNLRKAEEDAMRMEHDNREKLKVLDAKQMNNTREYERKIDSMHKEVSQLRDALSKSTKAQKKSEDERSRLLDEVDNLRMKIRSHNSSRKESQHTSSSKSYSRDAMKDRGDMMPRGHERGHDQRGHDQRGHDQRGHEQRGHERYSPDVWGDVENNGRKYDSNSPPFGPRGGEADRSRGWHGGHGNQEPWPGSKESLASLMRDFNKPEERMNPMRGGGGGGGGGVPLDMPQQGSSGQMGVEGQFGGQMLGLYDDFLMSTFGSGDKGRNQGISQSWRREASKF